MAIGKKRTGRVEAVAMGKTLEFQLEVDADGTLSLVSYKPGDKFKKHELYIDTRAMGQVVLIDNGNLELTNADVEE
jgi:hypothetical protein